MHVSCFSELQQNSRAVCRSHRQPQLFFPRFIVGCLDSFQALDQTNCDIGSSVNGELIAETHPRTRQERNVGVKIWGCGVPTLRSEDICIRSPMIFQAVEAIQRDENSRTLGQCYRGLAIGTSAHRQGCIPRCSMEAPRDWSMATHRCQNRQW
jgi:hypothetical protein